MVKAQKFILHKKCVGFPKSTDFKLVEEELPPLKEGEFLAEAVYLSVDPYMRAYMYKIPLENTMIGIQVAKITQSRNSNFPVGKYVAGTFGWRTHTISNGEHEDNNLHLPTILLPDIDGLTVSLFLGVLGMPGNTAYFGFLEICQPKEGETVVVSGAAGAVGSHVGQIAKIKGCKVIGIAGSDKKGKWLTNDLGFYHFINYKTQDIAKELKSAAPNGVDCYFDNVSGETSKIVMNQMNLNGRVCLCGAISVYNDLKDLDKKGLERQAQDAVASKNIKVSEFNVLRWADRWMEGVHQNLEWVKEGKLKYKETMTVGFQNMVNAFTDMLSGGNTGKALVKI